MTRTSPPIRKRGTRRGFTLVEIVVVLALIAVLISISLPALHGARERSGVARARAELFLIASALEDYRRLYGDYPQTGDCPQAQLEPTALINATQSQSRLFNALCGVFGPNARGVEDLTNGPCFLDAGKFSLEQPTSREFLTSSGAPPRKHEEGTCLLDPWGRRYSYLYKSASRPDTWRARGYLLFSAGPDGELVGPDSATGLFSAADDSTAQNADNISVSGPR